MFIVCLFNSLFYPHFFTNVVNSCLFMFAPSILLVEAAETPLFDNNSYHLNCSMLKIPILTSVPSCTCHFLPQPQFFPFLFPALLWAHGVRTQWHCPPRSTGTPRQPHRRRLPRSPGRTSLPSHRSPADSGRSRPETMGYPWDNHGSIAIGHFFVHPVVMTILQILWFYMQFSWVSCGKIIEQRLIFRPSLIFRG